MKKVLVATILSATLAGCASSGMGNAPGSQTGRAAMQGEKLPTETLTPGIASALFPDPSF